MSMIQAQVEELRSMAASVGLAVPQAATLMMEAADTIWELRCKCADLVDERERLFQANVEKNGEILRLVRENARLRELVRGLHMAYIGIIGQCESFDSSLTCMFSNDIDADLSKQHASYEQDRHRFDVAMRELGIEVRYEN